MTTAQIPKESPLQEVSDLLMKIIKSKTDLRIIKLFSLKTCSHILWMTILHRQLNEKSHKNKVNHFLPLRVIVLNEASKIMEENYSSLLS